MSAFSHSFNSPLCASTLRLKREMTVAMSFVMSEDDRLICSAAAFTEKYLSTASDALISDIFFAAEPYCSMSKQ